ncbi:NlpC/P60 family protein [Actinoallomurus purpureus]|uniref:C40 family peptidase n=1 Tax=Actinoallomurus purpureus TaxID=478114 RepID=UPI0020939E82|nr:C40 family peptidase [Actinoallomurus purpureus]MCO6006134.1 NlpC/P60 family protein [Actinoallomurus purpureus]
MAFFHPVTNEHAADRSRLRRSLRLYAALSVTAAVTLTAAPAEAGPKPSAAAAKKQLEKLNGQVDKIVDQYNKAKTELDAAKKKLTVLGSQTKGERHVYEGLRARAAQIAADAYKNGSLDSRTATLLASKNPDAALSQMSTFTQLSNNRGQELAAFLASTQRLRREQAEAQSAYQTVSQKAAALKKRKATVEKAIAKQKGLLRQAGEPTKAGGSGGGGTYNGPASGPARMAVQYAYAQLGKPYIWGGTGPKGYDCSGLTMMSWRAAGVNLPRVVPDQYNATRHVSKSDLQAGDLVYFDDMGHEGIYVGGGKFIHAPRTGEVIRLDSMSNPYWVSHYNGASRP